MYKVHPVLQNVIQDLNLSIEQKKVKTPYIVNPCQPANATVLTPEGIRTFANIQEGDLIWGKNSWVKVSKKWSTGVKKVFKYSTPAGFFLGTENHRIMENGLKIEVKDAAAIDVCLADVPWGCSKELPVDPQDVIDGIVLGDGGVHKASNNKVILHIGEKDGDYFDSEVSSFIKEKCSIGPTTWRVSTTISHEELPYTYLREIPKRFFEGSDAKKIGFLKGLFTANGCVTAKRVQYKCASKKLAEQLQLMLSSLGMRSSLCMNKPTEVEHKNGTYTSKASYNITLYNSAEEFMDLIGFVQRYKVMTPVKNTNPQSISSEIREVVFIGEEEVFDITVDHPEHVYWTGGLLVSNCGEIPLIVIGGYCVIGDVNLAACLSLSDAMDAVMWTARALIRTNQLPALYQEEVDATNRIGVGLTGIHEWMWKQYKINARDALDEYGVGAQFWCDLKILSNHAKAEANRYSQKLGVNCPTTVTTIKPAGTTSKLFGVTEGAHLPAFAYYMRWVQYRNDAPELAEFAAAGYPIRKLATYEATIVGFPTQTALGQTDIGDNIVLAGDFSPEEHFKWLMLLEKYWLGETQANQISYTLKYNPNKVSFEDFKKILLEYQSKVKCCSVMPEADVSAYEYLPEEPLTHVEFMRWKENITEKSEDVDREHVGCDNGACPIDFNK